MSLHRYKHSSCQTSLLFSLWFAKVSTCLGLMGRLWFHNSTNHTLRLPIQYQFLVRDRILEASTWAQLQKLLPSLGQPAASFPCCSFHLGSRTSSGLSLDNRRTSSGFGFSRVRAQTFQKSPAKLNCIPSRCLPGLLRVRNRLYNSLHYNSDHSKTRHQLSKFPCDNTESDDSYPYKPCLVPQSTASSRVLWNLWDSLCKTGSDYTPTWVQFTIQETQRPQPLLQVRAPSSARP